MTGYEVEQSAGRGMAKPVKTVLWFIAILAFLLVAWEGYKVLWKATESWFPWPVDGTNGEMPHVWDIVETLFSPPRRGSDTLLIWILLEAMVFTLREAVLGFAIGGSIGFLLGVLFVRSTLAERSFMPYVVASQTVPILAIAPMVVVWGDKLGLVRWVSVSIIAAYLTFFPVTINTLRGLRSPAPTAVELMRSYAASNNELLFKVQIPAAVPYIFTALKVSATASVIGAIIGELPSGFNQGLGRQLLLFSQQFAAQPEKLYGAVLVSALAGIVFVAAVALAERWLVAPTRRVAQ